MMDILKDYGKPHINTKQVAKVLGQCVSPYPYHVHNYHLHIAHKACTRTLLILLSASAVLRACVCLCPPEIKKRPSLHVHVHVHVCMERVHACGRLCMHSGTYLLSSCRNDGQHIVWAARERAFYGECDSQYTYNMYIIMLPTVLLVKITITLYMHTTHQIITSICVVLVDVFSSSGEVIVRGRLMLTHNNQLSPQHGCAIEPGSHSTVSIRCGSLLLRYALYLRIRSINCTVFPIHLESPCEHVNVHVCFCLK